MEIKQLLYFVMVVQQSSFSEAAKKLHLSQPSLSKAIKNLETEVGFRLLERTTKKIQLTDSGKVIYERALHILNEADILQQEIKEVKWNGSGKVQIGMIESVKNWIPSILHWYQQAFPSMKVKLIEVLSLEDVKRLLRQYKVHACLTNHFIDSPEFLTTPLYEERLAIIMHPGHLLASKESLTLADLEDEPFIITSDGFQTRRDIITVCNEEGIRLNIQYEVERFETIIELVRANIGISIIPHKYFDNRVDQSLVIKMIDSQSLKRTVYLTYLKSRYMPPAIEALIGRMQLPLTKNVSSIKRAEKK
ncbi:LysR family transcriptional regulator [Sporosarcina sp. GW1-11]|uniref:LysR family transcriptional regulator n=1 Tax=Sporosarcina sp. GW1-11 TaxID=2899126 RepID=UPI00294F93C0|nr:LysR family transcriptional regulator [Sporosarcina sp. GW1-11]MDV6379391.1 LysR family transcriptional regulator [Sporosarcina sp. GW1-11]